MSCQRVCVCVDFICKFATASNCSAVPGLHALPITTAPAKPFAARCAFTTRFLATVSTVKILPFHALRFYLQGFSADYLPVWRQFHTNFLNFSSQADIQLTRLFTAGFSTLNWTGLPSPLSLPCGSKLNWIGCPNSLLYNYFALTEWKTSFPTITIFVDACLRVRCLEKGCIST